MREPDWTNDRVIALGNMVNAYTWRCMLQPMAVDCYLNDDPHPLELIQEEMKEMREIFELLVDTNPIP